MCLAQPLHKESAHKDPVMHDLSQDSLPEVTALCNRFRINHVDCKGIWLSIISEYLYLMLAQTTSLELSRLIVDSQPLNCKRSQTIEDSMLPNLMHNPEQARELFPCTTYLTICTEIITNLFLVNLVLYFVILHAFQNCGYCFRISF